MSNFLYIDFCKRPYVEAGEKRKKGVDLNIINMRFGECKLFLEDCDATIKLKNFDLIFKFIKSNDIEESMEKYHELIKMAEKLMEIAYQFCFECGKSYGASK